MIVLEAILLLYFTFVSLYAFIFAVAARFFRTLNPPQSPVLRRFAILIPSYKEDKVIVSVAEEALRQQYPDDLYDVVVIADSLHDETIAKLKKLRIRVVEVAFERSTKVKSLNQALAVIGTHYDYAVILDADNVIEGTFLKRINDLIGLGYQAIQAERIAKNQTNSMSVLDGLSERINNYIYRQGHVAAGLSCSLIGSGMVFPYSVVKEILSGLESIGGFDRELELHLIRRGIKIHYGKGILVYDEKVDDPEVFERQRTRWLSSQFVYLRKYFNEGMASLFHGNFSMFNSAILKNIQLPRAINLFVLVVLCCVTPFLRGYLVISPYTWLSLLSLNAIAMAIAIPRRYYNREMLRSVLLLPAVVIRMVFLLFRLKGANRSFIHTPHTTTNVTTNENNTR